MYVCIVGNECNLSTKSAIFKWFTLCLYFIFSNYDIQYSGTPDWLFYKMFGLMEMLVVLKMLQHISENVEENLSLFKIIQLFDNTVQILYNLEMVLI